LNSKYQKAKNKLRPFYRKAVAKKAECKLKGIDFDLTEDHLMSVWVDVCPILGVPLDISAKKTDKYSPHLDRINPEKGYVVGNVQWLSGRANRLKNNITEDELRRLNKWLAK
jgi:hypothetical protein